MRPYSLIPLLVGGSLLMFCMEEELPVREQEEPAIIHYPQEIQRSKDILTGREVGVYVCPWEGNSEGGQLGFYFFLDLLKSQMQDAEIIYYLENADGRFLIPLFQNRQRNSASHVVEFPDKVGFSVLNYQQFPGAYAKVVAVVFLPEENRTPTTMRTQYDVEQHAERIINHHRNNNSYSL